MKKLTFAEIRRAKLEAILDSLLNFRTPSKTTYDVINDLKNRGLISTVNFDDLVQQRYGRPQSEREFEYFFCKVLTAYYLVHTLYLHEREISKGELSAAGEQAIALLRNTQAVLEEFVPEYTVYNYGTKSFIEYKPTVAETVINNIENLPEDISHVIAKLLKVMSNKDELLTLTEEAFKLLKGLRRSNLRGLKHAERKLWTAALHQAHSTRHLFMVLLHNLNQTKAITTDWHLSLRDVAHTLALNLSIVFKLSLLSKDLQDRFEAQKAQAEN